MTGSGEFHWPLQCQETLFRRIPDRESYRPTQRGPRPSRWDAQFGPLPLFRRKVRYADIMTAEVGRTLLLDGWGIHYSIRGGWVWNIWGRDCVVVHFRNGGALRIGTDDAENLAQFLEVKITETN